MDIKIINLRAIAILIVVLGHSIILYDSAWGLYNSDISMPLFVYIKQHLINPIQMPIFFFISGYLFYRSVFGKSNLPFIKFFKSKFHRLIIPYFCIAFLWMNPIKWVLKAPGYENISDFFNIFIHQVAFTNYLGHLWYLPTLFGIFIVAFLCHSLIFRNIGIKHHKYLYLSLFTFFLFLHYMSEHITSRFCLSYIANYLIFFFAGFFFHYLKLNINALPQNKKMYIVTLTGILLCSYFCTILRPISVILFIIISYLLIPDKTNNIIRSISDNSFGIYLLHSPLIYITYTYFTNSNPWFVLFLNFVVMGTVSYLLTIYISKTRFKFIIGGK